MSTTDAATAAIARGADFAAPAKLNLRLRILGRRPDGMHLLDSDAVLLSLADRVRIGLRPDGLVWRAWRDARVDDDLCVRAATLLRTTALDAGVELGRLGADIFVEKKIPIGGGLGGASSDAATTLLALNRLWGLHWPRRRLMELGLKLGADVPFFLSGLGAAKLGGIGEEISPLSTTTTTTTEGTGTTGEADGGTGTMTGGMGGVGGFFVVGFPGRGAATAAVYGAHDAQARKKKMSGLTSGAKSAIIALSRWNDLTAAACCLRPEIADCARALGSAARMTGSGSCVFARAGSEKEAEQKRAELEREGWPSWTARSLKAHPLRDFAGAE